MSERNPAATPQPEPSKGTVRILDLVTRDLKDRAETGRRKYGTYLEASNGRDALMDAYQEALDLCMYLRQEIEERVGRHAKELRDAEQSGYDAGLVHGEEFAKAEMTRRCQERASDSGQGGGDE